ncbi:MAG: hypothetical protein AAGF24_01555, partial [Cyanobacteria bacterium P01_H01_bin.121]
LLEDRLGHALPEVEEIPVYIEEDGTSGLNLALMTRRTEAQEHWYGNTEFTQLDMMARLVDSMGDENELDEIDEDAIAGELVDSTLHEENEENADSDATPESDESDTNPDIVTDEPAATEEQTPEPN